MTENQLILSQNNDMLLRSPKFRQQIDLFIRDEEINLKPFRTIELHDFVNHVFDVSAKA